MLGEERRQKIQEMLSQQKRLLVNDLCVNFNASAVTIRKDLEILRKRGSLTRVHGGAILNQSSVTDLALTEKERIHHKEKDRIAQCAGSMINRGDVIILDSGSTTTQLARHIKFKKGIIVITNAVNIATELAASDLEIILTGGILREKSFSLVGPLAENTLQSVTADKLFLGVDGIDFKFGLTTPNLLEAKVNHMMMDVSKEVILLADSTKFGMRSVGVISQINEIDKIVTDSGVSEEDVKRMDNLGIEVIIV